MPVPPGFVQDCRKQAKFAAGRSPLYEILFASIGSWYEDPANGWYRDLLADSWKTREFGAWFEPALVVAASLHASVLRGDAGSEGLRPFFARREGLPLTAEERTAFLALCIERLREPNPAILDTLKDGRIQTNEIRRSVLWLLTAAWLGTQDFDLVELGASAGLSLVADRLGWIVNYPGGTNCSFGGSGTMLLETPVTEGDAPVPHPRRISNRIAIDRNPLDPGDPANRLWLKALVWPDQKGRMDLLERTLDQAVNPGSPKIEFVRMDLPGEFDPEAWARKTRPVLFWNSITTGYFSDADYAELKRRMAAVLDRRPGAWLEFELLREGSPHRPLIRKEEAALVLHRRRNGCWAETLLAGAEAHVPSVRWLAGPISKD